jgi:hypothetical protein
MPTWVKGAMSSAVSSPMCSPVLLSSPGELRLRRGCACALPRALKLPCLRACVLFKP